MITDTLLVTISAITCHKCGAIYGLNDSFKERARKDCSMTWHCPHCEVGTAFCDSENEKLKKQVAQLQTNLEHKEALVSSLREQRTALERSRSALRGVHTRTCNRVKNGVCPCCNRTFSNLAAHMHSQHPDFKAAE